jgi:hypothetical protein
MREELLLGFSEHDEVLPCLLASCSPAFVSVCAFTGQIAVLCCTAGVFRDSIPLVPGADDALLLSAMLKR